MDWLLPDECDECSEEGDISPRSDRLAPPEGEMEEDSRSFLSIYKEIFIDFPA